jgi:hypothetical protein
MKKLSLLGATLGAALLCAARCNPFAAGTLSEMAVPQPSHAFCLHSNQLSSAYGRFNSCDSAPD